MMTAKVGAFLTLMMTSCSLPTEVCTLGGTPAVEVDIQDSVTLEPLAAGARVRLEATHYLDTVPAIIDRAQRRIAIGAGAHGTFDLTIEQTGYRLWRRAGVVVTTTGRCKRPKTVLLQANLQKL